MDAFTGNSNRQPGELISINPLILIAALTKKNSPDYKLHQKLLGDEHEQYIDRHFNKGIVSRVTILKGDTLAEFLPATGQLSTSHKPLRFTIWRFI